MHCFELHIIMSQGLRSYGKGNVQLHKSWSRLQLASTARNSSWAAQGCGVGWCRGLKGGGGGVHRLNSESLGTVWGEREQKSPKPFNCVSRTGYAAAKCCSTHRDYHLPLALKGGRPIARPCCCAISSLLESGAGGGWYACGGSSPWFEHSTTWASQVTY